MLGAADTIRLRPIKTSILVPDLIHAISRSTCPRRLLLLDSCRGSTDQTRDTESLNPAFAAALAKARGTAVLSAAAEGGKAYDDPALGQGVFTHFILEGLRGAAGTNSDGFVTARDLSDFVQENVGRWVAVHRPDLGLKFPGIASHFDGASQNLPLAFVPEKRRSSPDVQAMAGGKPERHQHRPLKESVVFDSKPESRAEHRRRRHRWPGLLGVAAFASLMLLGIWSVSSYFTKEEILSWFETIFKVLSSSWGSWSVAAFALGIFLLITNALIKKARPGKFDGQQTYQFFRMAMVLAFLLALAGLVVATFRESGGGSSGPTTEERIKQLVLELKSEDPSRRRQVSEALIGYGDRAADELVLVIREEAGQVAAELLSQSTSGDWSVLFAGLLGAKPWETPFLNSAARTLAAIGEPAVPAIFDGIAADSVEAERMMIENAQRKVPENPNLGESLGQLGTLFDLAGKGTRISIARETLASALNQMNPPPINHLLSGLESPRTLLKMTCYQILVGKPEARNATIERLQSIANESEPKERDQILAAIQQLRASSGN